MEMRIERPQATASVPAWALAAATISQFANTLPGQRIFQQIRSRSRPKRRAATTLTVADAKYQLGRMEERRASTTLDSIKNRADVAPKSLSLPEAKRILAKVQERNRTKHGIKSLRSGSLILSR
jgi:hypothetical protein